MPVFSELSLSLRELFRVRALFDNDKVGANLAILRAERLKVRFNRLRVVMQSLAIFLFMLVVVRLLLLPLFRELVEGGGRLGDGGETSIFEDDSGVGLREDLGSVLPDELVFFHAIIFFRDGAVVTLGFHEELHEIGAGELADLPFVCIHMTLSANKVPLQEYVPVIF